MSLWDRLRGRGQAEKAAAFWSWFASVADQGREIARQGSSPDLEAWVDDLNQHTTAFHPLVRALVGVSSEKPELILTADGEAAGAEHVRALAQAAPPLTGWVVRAFKPQFDTADSIVCRHEDVALTCDDVEFSVIEMETPETGAVTLLVFFVRGLAGPRGDDVERLADQLLQIVLGEERALRWLEYSMTWDSEVREEKLEGIPRMPLAEIGKLFEELDPQIGPRR